MRRFSEYSTVIFDCDGVIFDSNALKINAMAKALEQQKIPSEQVRMCRDFFTANFGKSRFYHVDYFLQNILSLEKQDIELMRKQILSSFSTQCQQLYLEAETSPGIVELLTQSNVQKYIASGSEQEELRCVFEHRKMDHFFVEILGSPRKKSDLVADILTDADTQYSVMIGDARSDLEAAEKNGIDFIYYSPFSNVDELMRPLCAENGYRILDSFYELVKEL